MAIVIPSRNIYGDMKRNIVSKFKPSSVSVKEKVLSKETATFLSVSHNPSSVDEENLKFVIDAAIESPSITSVEIISDGNLGGSGFQSGETSLVIKGVISSNKYIVFDEIKVFVKMEARSGKAVNDLEPVDGNTANMQEISSVVRRFSAVLKAGQSKLWQTSGVDFSKPIVFNIGDSYVAENSTERGEYEKKSYDFVLKVPLAEVTSASWSYFVTNLEFEIYGKVYAEQEADETFGTGETYNIESNPFLVHGSKLVNGENKYDLIYELSNHIISEYSNGKETIQMRCDIADYYDENGEKAISIRGGDLAMCFMIGDLVKPMKLNERGENVPISRYKDGTPKIFRVCATNIFFDGAVWQELTLVEKSQTALAT